MTEWWHDETVRAMRKPNGEFPPYSHSLGTTVRGEQYMAPWHLPGRHRYVVDDFGNWAERSPQNWTVAP